jgi:hypothetical protein
MPKFLLVFFIHSLCFNAQTFQYYFGNLHAHTSFSDGNRDSLQANIYGPSGSYLYAKNSQHFDFLGISEHNHFSTTKNPGFRRPRFAEGLAIASGLNQDGKFLCLYGMEYGVSSANNGHVIIYGYDQLIGWESNVGGILGPNYDVYNGRSDYAGLFQKIKNKSGTFACLAHPYWTDFTTDGTDSTALAFAPYSAVVDSAICGMPLRSGNAFSTFTNYSDYAPLNYFNYFKKMLNQGYHLGIGYDHDNHYSNFGRSNGGRLVVLMPELRQQHLFSAMKARRFYGSDDSNAELDFRLNGAVMGQVMRSDAYPKISIQHLDPDGEKADTIRIWKGFRGSNAWAYTVAECLSTDLYEFTDKNVIPGREYYYFCELRQKDGQWMVTSPIWYTGSQLLGTHDFSEDWPVQWTYFPIQQTVACSSSYPSSIRLTIMTVTGKEQLTEVWEEGQKQIDVSSLAPGIYLLQFSTGNQRRCFKLIR